MRSSQSTTQIGQIEQQVNGNQKGNICAFYNRVLRAGDVKIIYKQETFQLK